MPLIPIPNPVSGIGNAIAGQIKDRFEEMMTTLAKAVVRAAAAVFGMAVDAINSSSTPNLKAPWFEFGPYEKMLGIAAFLLVSMLVVGVCHAVASGDPGAVVRRVIVEAPGAVLHLTLLLTVTTVGVGLIDALSADLMEGSAGPVQEFSEKLLGIVARSPASLASVTVFGWSSFFLLIAALAVWAELLVRSALIYLLVALSPLAIAARVWPTTRSMSTRVNQYLAGFVISKLIAAVCLSVGLAALANGGPPPATAPAAPGTPGAPGAAAIDAEAPTAEDRVDIGTILVGVALVGLAAFAPFTAIRLMPVADNAAAQQGIKGSPGRAVTTAASTVVLAKSLKGG